MRDALKTNTNVPSAKKSSLERKLKSITKSPLFQLMEGIFPTTKKSTECSPSAEQTSGHSVAAVTESKPTKRIENESATNPSHYRQGKIEPWDFITSQKMGYLEGNVVKYVSRWRHKNGLEDLEKARVYLNKLIDEVSRA